MLVRCEVWDPDLPGDALYVNPVKVECVLQTSKQLRGVLEPISMITFSEGLVVLVSGHVARDLSTGMLCV